MSEEAEPARPMLRIITPGTTPEEVAAIVAVLSSLGSTTGAEPEPARIWASAERALKIPVRSGAGAWRASLLPR